MSKSIPRQHLVTAFRLYRHLIAMRLDPDSCWEWRGVVNNWGNPIWKYNETSTTTARLVWHHVFKQRFNQYKGICQSCSNKLCLRPSHLFRDSVKDITLAHGDQTNVHPVRKIDRQTAMTIRFSKEPARRLAAKYDLSIASIYAIRRRRYWK